MIFKRTVLMTVLFVLGTILVLANGVDDWGNPNDPAVNEHANACFEGGSMEGKCDTDWEWVCGWYIIRLDPQNLESRAAFPSACASLLPPYIEYTPPTGLETGPNYPGIGCVQINNYPMSIDFGGGYYLPSGITYWNTADCSGTPGVGNLGGGPFIYAPGGQDVANTICSENGQQPANTVLLNDVYACWG